jgi:glycosyltransferase involved in cell wall biosynthesis
MRIAYLINQYPAISHSFIRREIIALEQLGLEILRISIRGWNQELADEQDQLERKRTRYVLRTNRVTLLFSAVRMLLQRPIRFMRALATAWHMSRCSDRPLHVHLAYVVEACVIELWLRNANVKHLHAHFGTNSAEVAMLVHILGGPPWSFTAHGIETFDNPRLVGLSEKILSCVFAVAVSSYGRAQMYRSVPPQYWLKVHLVHCGLELGSLAPVDASGGLKDGFVCVGRFSPEKGHIILLDAARQLAEQSIPFKLTLAGDGELRPQLEAMIAQYKLQERVHITGWVSEAQVRAAILAARALILPSLAEGLPVVLMEAMALCRPVIASCLAGIPELVRDGKDGWLVPAGDVFSLVQAMRACLDASQDSLWCMGNAGRQRVLENHDINTEALKLRDLYYLYAD